MDVFSKITIPSSSNLAQYAPLAENYFIFPKLEGELSTHMLFEGKPVLVWSLNNYLGLANHPEVRKTDTEAVAQFGLAHPMGSRLLTGNTKFHENLEQQLSIFMNKEASFLFNYGYQGCASTIQAITDRNDIIIYDQFSHASIVDGCRLSLAKHFTFQHNNIEQLEHHLNMVQPLLEHTQGGILVITEGVFGMHGDTGRLDQIVKLKSKYPFRLFVDDAHGFGIMGSSGQGTGEFYQVQSEIDLLFCTFAKSMACIGGFVCGEKEIIQFLRYNTRSQIYAKSLPTAIAIGAQKRLELLQTQNHMRENLWFIAHSLQNGLRKEGFFLGPNNNTPITPVYLDGSVYESLPLIRDLRETYGIFVSAVTYPVIEFGKILIRLIPTAEHTIEDVEHTLFAFREVQQKLKKGHYQN